MLQARFSGEPALYRPPGALRGQCLDSPGCIAGGEVPDRVPLGGYLFKAEALRIQRGDIAGRVGRIDSYIGAGPVGSVPGLMSPLIFLSPV